MILVIFYIALYYLRPAEWVPGLVGAPLLMVVGVVSLLYIGAKVVSGNAPFTFSGKTERMMFGLVVAIALSHLGHFYAGGAISSLVSFFPTITGFLLVSCVLDNRKRVTAFVLLLIVLTTILAYEGLHQYSTGFSHGGMELLYEKKMMTNGEIAHSPRIRWYGVFNDPNDLGLALVLVVPFLLDMLLQRHFLVPLASLPLIATAIYYTNSRGTVLAGLVAIGSYFVIRFRSFYGVLVGVMLAMGLFFVGPSRMASVSASEDSAYGRIEAWFQAYQMFKANPLLGVGQGMFTDFNNLTAHNSFVLVMAELGVLGLFFFTGLFYFPYYWLWGNFFKKTATTLTPEDIGLVSSVFASLTGMLASMFFLSRSYTLIPFMQVALVMAVTRVLGKEMSVGTTITEGKPHHFRSIFVLTVVQIIVINIIVKISI